MTTHFFCGHEERLRLPRFAKKSRTEGNLMTQKAPERPCRSCSAPIPAQPSGPGRPREFCSTECRRSFHYDREREREEAARQEAWERTRYRLDVQYHGKRRADQLARKRAEGRSNA